MLQKDGKERQGNMRNRKQGGKAKMERKKENEGRKKAKDGNNKGRKRRKSCKHEGRKMDRMKGKWNRKEKHTGRMIIK